MDDRPWKITPDKKFLQRVEELRSSGGNLFDNLRKTIERIKDDPLTGDPKTGQLKGHRTTHVEHLVLRWEVIPETHRRENIDRIEEVYFWSIDHHDKMTKGLSPSRRPVEASAGCTIRFSSHAVGKELNQLYELEYLDLESPEWGNSGVTLSGSCAREKRADLRDDLPESAILEFHEEEVV